MEQIVVLEATDEELPIKMYDYKNTLLEINPTWEAVDGLLASRTSHLECLPDKSVVWQMFYESALTKQEFYERKYAKHS